MEAGHGVVYPYSPGTQRLRQGDQVFKASLGYSQTLLKKELGGVIQINLGFLFLLVFVVLVMERSG